MISSKTSHHLVRSSRSLSATDLNSSHVYSSLDDLIVKSKQENEQRGKVVSCEDIFHKKPFFPDITPSESGVSVGEWEEGSTYGGEEDNMSQRSFGSSSAFFDGTVDSEIEKFDSDNCSGHDFFRDGEQDDSRNTRRCMSRKSSNEVAIPDGIWSSPISSFGESKRKEFMSRDFEIDQSRFGALKVHIPASDPLTKAGKDNNQTLYSRVLSSTPLAQSTPHVSPRGLGELKLSVKASWMADYPLKESNIETGPSKLEPERALIDMDLSDNDLQGLSRINDSSFSDDNFSDISNATITSPELRKPKLVKKLSSKPKTPSAILSFMPQSFGEHTEKVDNSHGVYQPCSDAMGIDGDPANAQNAVNPYCSPDGRSIIGNEWWALYNIGAAKERKALGKSHERMDLENGDVVLESRREKTDGVRLPLITPGKHGQEKLRRASQTSPQSSDRSSPVHHLADDLQTVGNVSVKGSNISQNDREMRTENESRMLIEEREFLQGENTPCYEESLDTVLVEKSVVFQDRERVNKPQTKAKIVIDFINSETTTADGVTNELADRTNKHREFRLTDDEEEYVGHMRKNVTIIGTEIEHNAFDSGLTADSGKTRADNVTQSVIPLTSPLHHVNSWTNSSNATDDSLAMHGNIDQVGVSNSGDKEQLPQQPSLTVGLTGRADTGMSTENTNTDGFIDSRLAVGEGGEIPLLNLRDTAAVVNFQCVDETKNIHKGGLAFSVPDKITQRISSESVSRTGRNVDASEIGESSHTVKRVCEDSTPVLSTEIGSVTVDCASVNDVVSVDSSDSYIDSRDTCELRIVRQSSHDHPVLGPVDESIKECGDARFSDINCQAENKTFESGVVSEGIAYDANILSHNETSHSFKNYAVSDSKCIDSKERTLYNGSIANTRDPTHEAVNADNPPFLSVATLTQETGSVVVATSSNPCLCQDTHRFIASSGVSFDDVKTALSDSESCTHCSDPHHTSSSLTRPITYVGSDTSSHTAMQHNNPLDNLHAQLSLISAADATNDVVDCYQDHAEATHVADDVYEDSGDYCYLSEPTENIGTYYSYSIEVHSSTEEEASPREQYDNEDGITTHISTYTPRRHLQYSLIKPKSSSLWTLEEETESMLEAQSPKGSPKRSLSTVSSEEEKRSDESSPLELSPVATEPLTGNTSFNQNVEILDQLLGPHSLEFTKDSQQAHQGDISIHAGDDIQHEHLSPIDLSSVPLHAIDTRWSSFGQGEGAYLTTSLCGPIPVNNFSNVVTSPLEVLSSRLQQFGNYEEEDDLFIAEDERDYSTNLDTSKQTRHDAPLSWNDDEVSECSSRIHDFDHEVSLLSSSVSPSPSDASEGLYTCVGTAQVKHALPSFDYDNPASTYTENITKEQVKETPINQDIVIDKDDDLDQFEKLLEEFNQGTSPLTDIGEIVLCDVHKEGTLLRPTEQLDNLYKAFTNEDSEKKQNHVCIVIEDDNMSSYRLKRYLKKSHTKRTAGKKVIKFLTKLGCVSETTTSPELSPNRSRSEHEELVFSTDSMPLAHTHFSRPTLLNSSCFQDLHLLTRSAHGLSSTTSSNQSLDSLKSRADSAYSSFSESMAGELTSPRIPSISLLSPACPFSSTGSVFRDNPFSPNDSVCYSASTDKTHHPSGPSRSGETSSPNSEVMTALSDVFDQLDVCNDEIDTALLNRLRHGHTRADVNSK